MERQQRTSPRMRGVALLLAVLAVVAGCSTSRPPRPSAPQTASTSRAAAARSVLASDVTSLRVNWYLSRAEKQLTAQCMKRHGFVYLTPGLGPEPSAATVTTYALGSGRPATYGVTPGIISAKPVTEPGGTQPRYSLALQGPPTAMATVTFASEGSVSYETSGCIGSARAELYGSVRAYVIAAYLPQVEGNLFDKFTGTYRPYQSALHAWQACMKTDKLPYANPDAAIASIQQLAMTGVGTAEVMRRQAATADADTACDAHAHLRERTSQALGRFVESLSPQGVAQLGDVARDRARAYQVARRVVSP